MRKSLPCNTDCLKNTHNNFNVMCMENKVIDPLTFFGGISQAKKTVVHPHSHNGSLLVVCVSEASVSVVLSCIRESPPHFGNRRIMTQVYVRSIIPKRPILLAGTGVSKNSSVACGFSSIKIDYSDYLKRLIIRINEVISIFY